MVPVQPISTHILSNLVNSNWCHYIPLACVPARWNHFVGCLALSAFGDVHYALSRSRPGGIGGISRAIRLTEGPSTNYTANRRGAWAG